MAQIRQPDSSLRSRVWAIPHCRLTVLSFLPIADQRRALFISKSSFPEAVKVSHRSLTLRDYLRLQKRCKDPARLAIYLAAIVHLDWDGQFPSNFGSYSALPEFQRCRNLQDLVIDNIHWCRSPESPQVIEILVRHTWAVFESTEEPTLPTIASYGFPESWTVKPRYSIKLYHPRSRRWSTAAWLTRPMIKPDNLPDIFRAEIFHLDISCSILNEELMAILRLRAQAGYAPIPYLALSLGQLNHILVNEIGRLQGSHVQHLELGRDKDHSPNLSPTGMLQTVQWDQFPNLEILDFTVWAESHRDEDPTWNPADPPNYRYPTYPFISPLFDMSHAPHCPKLKRLLMGIATPTTDAGNESSIFMPAEVLPSHFDMANALLRIGGPGCDYRVTYMTSPHDTPEEAQQFVALRYYIEIGVRKEINSILARLGVAPDHLQITCDHRYH
ncbi:hypothetical protein BCR39DRAFT_187357 [Naematelia encephala]|uniref:Uncharacterized protein n=1 Tax=Naematelia encephala TaxID=71784 RepID=A0A1Y2B251_9TREE|nr:hypothetical protein BCR39DRAFT_187357 [Naematelia encephala]